MNAILHNNQLCIMNLHVTDLVPQLEELHWEGFHKAEAYVLCLQKAVCF